MTGFESITPPTTRTVSPWEPFKRSYAAWRDPQQSELLKEWFTAANGGDQVFADMRESSVAGEDWDALSTWSAETESQAGGSRQSLGALRRAASTPSEGELNLARIVEEREGNALDTASEDGVYCGLAEAAEAAEAAEERIANRLYKDSDARVVTDRNRSITPQKRQKEVARKKAPRIKPSRFVAFFGIIVLSMQQLAGTPLPFGFSELDWEGLPHAPLPGHPEQGDFFADGSQGRVGVEVQLRQAVPVGWRGAASENYAGANAELAVLSRQLTDADSMMARYVNEQAERVGDAQLRLGIEQDALIAAYLVICYLESVFQYYWIAWLLAVSCVVGAVTECIYVLTDCNEASKRRRDQADDVDYPAITRAAHELIERYRYTPSEAGRSAARTGAIHFTDVRDSGAASSARSATVAASPHQVGGGPARTPRGAATGTGPAAALALVPSQPASGTPKLAVASRPAVLHPAAAHPGPQRANGAGQLGQQPAPAAVARSGNSQQSTAGAGAGRRAPVHAAAVRPHQGLKPRPARVETAANRLATLADAWSHD